MKKIFPRYKPLPVLRKVVNSGNVDGACLGIIEATALSTFAVMSKARLGLFITFFAIFFETLSPFLPRFSKKLPSLLACIVLSLTVIYFLYYKSNINQLILFYF